MIPVGKLVESVDGHNGFWFGRLGTDRDLAAVRNIVTTSFLRRVQKIAPHSADIFVAAGMDNYHRCCHLVDHQRLMDRHGRKLTEEEVDAFMSTGFFRSVAAMFEVAEITNEEDGQYPEIHWRLVRPHQHNDYGPLHADHWFWELNGWPCPPGKRRIKCWTMVYGEINKMGLRVVPGSQIRDDWKRISEERHGLLKPVFDEAASGVEPILLPVPAGGSIVFDYRLLHGGHPNTGEICRVSIEYTVFVPR